MAILTLSQAFDMSNVAIDWTPPAPVQNATELTFTSADLSLELGSKGARPAGFLSYQNGQVSGGLGEIHLSNASGAILGITTGSADPDQIVGLPLGGTLAQWLTLTGVFDGADLLTGSSGNDVLLAYGGNDLIHASAGNDKVDGGSGFDTMTWAGDFADYKVARGANGFTVTRLADGSVDTVANVERLSFDDKIVAADVAVDNAGGEVFRLYEAAFGRLPDEPGLTYWTDRIDAGVTLDAVASAFIGSAEFQSRYGANLSNHDLVNGFYENVLHRAPDADGLAYWTGLLDRHAATGAQVLAAISDSPEHIDGTAALIANGLVLDHPAGFVTL